MDRGRSDTGACWRGRIGRRLRDRLNLVLKRRVWYQPFCPSLLESDARAALSDFTGPPNRHMTMAYLVAAEHRESLCGVINVDGSCRPQMVADEAPGPFAELLRKCGRASASARC